jgi:4'-phosphopantetheinyl transferase
VAHSHDGSVGIAAARKPEPPSPQMQGTGGPAFVSSWRKSIRLSRTAGYASVRVWLAPVERIAQDHSNCRVLNQDDLARLAQTRCEKARNSSLAGKVLLRTALSSAVEGAIAPWQWRIAISANGQPTVAREMPQLNFGIAHSDDIVAVAVSNAVPIGIDVEAVEDVPTPALLELVCSPSQRRRFTPERGDQNARDFIRFWTLKESYAKLAGLGHGMDFAAIELNGATVQAATDAACCSGETRAHFESLWVSTADKFSHVSVAIGTSHVQLGSVDLQLMTMADPGSGGGYDTVVSPHLQL